MAVRKNIERYCAFRDMFPAEINREWQRVGELARERNINLKTAGPQAVKQLFRDARMDYATEIIKKKFAKNRAIPPGTAAKTIETIVGLFDAKERGPLRRLPTKPEIVRTVRGALKDFPRWEKQGK